MYLDFFQLHHEPFHVTPDPAFCYFSPDHREALAALIYAVEQRKGFIALTGEVGVGKTTIIRAFLERIDQAQTKIIYFMNTNVEFDDLLEMLLLEFGTNDHCIWALVEDESRAGQSFDFPSPSRPVPREEAGDKSTFQRVNQLHRHLIEHFYQDRNVVLIIDEAQNMPANTLEGLRVLSNLETASDKLLQIVFCGQPEFDEQLSRPELRQLAQRIAVRATISPLSDVEGVRYIQHRLAKAGVPGSTIFTKGAISQILQEAQGIPRLINILCDNALVTAFGYQVRQVTASIAKEIIIDRKAESQRRPRRWPMQAIGIATATVLAGLSLSGMIVPLTSGAEGLWGWAEGNSSAVNSMSGSAQNPEEIPKTQQIPPMVDQTMAPGEPISAGMSTKAADEESETATSETITLKVSEQHSVLGMARDTATIQPAKAITAEPLAVMASQPELSTRIVKPGDRLLDLVEDVYGLRDESLVQLVTQHNPQVKSSNLIRIGDRLVFPPNNLQERGR